MFHDILHPAYDVEKIAHLHNKFNFENWNDDSLNIFINKF
jgi:hypothetical protein